MQLNYKVNLLQVIYLSISKNHKYKNEIKYHYFRVYCPYNCFEV